MVENTLDEGGSRSVSVREDIASPSVGSSKSDGESSTWGATGSNPGFSFAKVINLSIVNEIELKGYLVCPIA